MTLPYKKILGASIDRLRSHGSALGLERIVQEEIASALPGAVREVPLSKVRAKTIDGETDGRIDLVHGDHGIEVKVIQFLRLNAVPSKALYDIGQLSADYWRLAHAKDLRTGELVVLLCGPLVASLQSPSAVCREFQNRMYIDYQTSRIHGELLKESCLPHRKRQVDSIKHMGLDGPAKNGRRFKTVVSGDYAMLSIEVDF